MLPQCALLRSKQITELLSQRRLPEPQRAEADAQLSRDPTNLEGSFSAVSKPNFASKYAFESSRRDLHNALLCTAPKSHFFQKK